MAILRLIVRAAAWRRGASIAVLLVALVAITAATTGPLYVRAASESVLRDTLTTADPADTALDASDHTVPSTAAFSTLQLGEAPLDHYRQPIATMRIEAKIEKPDLSEGADTTLVWRDGACARLNVEQGRCPTGPGQIVVHRDLARQFGLRVGMPFPASLASASRFDPAAGMFRVVGIYTPRNPNDPYWTGHTSDFTADGSTKDNSPHTEALFTSAATFDALASQSPQPLGYVETVRLVNVASVRLADVGDLRQTTAAAARTLRARGPDMDVETGVAGVLDRVHHDNHRLTTATVLILGQLLLLCLAVLLLVVATSAQARAGEIAAAKVRGLRPAATVLLALGEPLLLLAVATPLGLAAGYGAARLLAWIRLVPGTPVVLTAPTWWALLVALAGAGLATVYASRHALRTAPIDLWQRTARRSVGFGRAATGRDVVLAAAGVGALVAARAAGDPWVLLSPVLVALLAALAGLRLLPVVCGPLLRAGRAGRRVASFLVVRQIVRRPDGAQVTALLVVAFALAATATTAWSIGRQNAHDRAYAQTGATRVLFVQPDAAHPTLNLLAAVRRADPRGRDAMAVEEYLPFSGQPGGRLLAVDAARFRGIADWRSDFAGSSLGTLLDELGTGSAVDPTAVLTHSAFQSALGVPGQSGQVAITGVDGGQLAVRAVGQVDLLPRAGSFGTLMDLADVTSEPDLTALICLPEVWLSPHAQVGAVTARLRSVGLTVTDSESAPAAQQLLTRQGPQLAVLLSLTAAILAVVLAGATTICAVYLSGRRRAFELAALAAIGVPAPELRRATRTEPLVLLLAALVLGVAAGAVGSALTLPSVPQFADDVTFPPLLWLPQPLVVAVAVVATVAVAVLAAVLSSRLLMRAAVPERLRESQT